MGELIQFPKDNERSWDGDPTQSMRWTSREGLVEEGGEEAYADLWVANLGLPPRLNGELWHQWAERTEKERAVGDTLENNNTEQETA